MVPAGDTGAPQWTQVTVPGQADKQGVPLKRGTRYVYRHSFVVPADFRQQRIFLRFESVSGTAELFVNGKALEGHKGGFTIWNREITHMVEPGSSATILLHITDPLYDHWPSGFDTGGILRSVRLLAVPQDYITRLHAETTCNSDFTQATLHVDVASDVTADAHPSVMFALQDPSGVPVKLKQERFPVARTQPELRLSLPVPSPQLWDAEHPRLYTLTAHLVIAGKTVTTVKRRIGLREVTLQGRRLLVNGREVKLRGGGRFDSDPHLGHTLSVDQCEQEVKLFKEANLNYIRPACWPASEAYLDACDRFGMYVEGETSVTFSHGPEKELAFESLFVDQVAEMIEANRTHPCILFWSLGNESNYGPNIQRSFAYVQAVDQGRPVLFSWSHGVPAGKLLPYTLYSYHYPGITADMGKPGVAVFNGGKLWREIPPMPVLHDEFAHLACYDRDELRRDPGVRNFWGEGIRQFWEKMFTTEGCLGGAVWALVDEPDNGAKTYQWGVLDLYRRKRPEYWLLRKAYSPIRLGSMRRSADSSIPAIEFGLANWFDHTNLDEIEVHWRAGEHEGRLRAPSIAPRLTGTLRLEHIAFASAPWVELSFHHGGLQVEEARLALEAPKPGPTPGVARVPLQESEDVITARHGKQVFSLDRRRGVIHGQLGRGPLLEGPDFHLSGGSSLPTFEPGQSHSIRSSDGSSITFAGRYGNLVGVRYIVSFLSSGWVQLTWTLEQMDVAPPQRRVVPWNDTDAGGFEEIGVSFLLASSFDELRWRRRALYSIYPEDHVGRPEGKAPRHSPVPPRRLGDTPAVSWNLDEQDFDLYGPNDLGGRGTNDFRSTKEFFESALVVSTIDGQVLEFLGDGSAGVRLQIEGQGVRVVVLSQCNYTHLGNGNYMRKPVLPKAGDSASVRFQLRSLRD